MEQLATGYGLIEAPVWDSDRGLFFSDVLKGGVHCISPSAAVSTVLPDRRGIGGMALHEQDGLVVGGRTISYESLAGGRTVVLMERSVMPEVVGFNDLTTDARGRVYVGSLAFRVFAGGPPKPGYLHLIDLDGSVRTVADGVWLTNGLGVSPEGTRLYHSDSRADHVRVYDVRADGSVGHWRVFAELRGAVPDGLAVAADGSVWVAAARGGCVIAFDPDGTERLRLPVPLPMVTSVCFGGSDLRDLYVVTGSEGGPNTNCGTVYRTRVEVPGLALSPARVRLG
jgi:D-xylonolactonase